VNASNAPTARGQTERTASIDLLRGIVMVIMALDHARDFLGQTPFDPTDLDKTNPALFFTRWITHFCAPTFVFLAGTSAWLSRAKKTDSELSLFLLKRGVWLVFFEIAINNLCWSFDLTYSFTILQVIWAIGCSMIFLSLLVRLSPGVIAAIGLAIVLSHNAFDHLDPGDKPPWHTLWAVAHHPDFGLSLGTHRYGVFYPLIPWIGVMALGYAFGSIFRTASGTTQPREQRTRLIFRIGLAVTIGFVLVRALNVYGDPTPWAPRGTLIGTVMSFLDCQKYPPSLCYLTMTLGPAILLLSLFERVTVSEKGIAGIFVVYGRVPFFYYMLHVLLIHAASEVVYSLKTGRVTVQRQWGGPEALNIGLPLTYVAWILAVAMLYPLCLWFSRVKASAWGRQRGWLSYL
jgi:uncharacterized membrane protein